MGEYIKDLREILRDIWNLLLNGRDISLPFKMLDQITPREGPNDEIGEELKTLKGMLSILLKKKDEELYVLSFESMRKIKELMDEINEKKIYAPVQYLKGVGPKKARLLNKLGIFSIRDLLFYFPRRYEDRGDIIPIRDVVEDELFVVLGQVFTHNYIRTNKERDILKIGIEDGTGELYLVCFNREFLKDILYIGRKVLVIGKAKYRFGEYQVADFEYELPEKKEIKEATGIIPIYPLTEGITQKEFRSIVKNALFFYAPYLYDPLPFSIRERNDLISLPFSLRDIHTPFLERNGVIYNQRRARSQKRFIFEEFFIFQLPMALKKKTYTRKKGISFPFREELLKEFEEKLPFTLTEAQKRVIREIIGDMQKPHPMNRLIQGDVGSGKTVVASFAMLVAANAGYQSAIMAPTEILAEQHFIVLRDFLSYFDVKVELLTRSTSQKNRKEILNRLKEGDIDIIVGTHALIQDDVIFNKLGLVVIDEQHKFGVVQRAKLMSKGHNPDVIVMTATPIPRTLALSLYGDLDISVIDEKPQERGEIKTYYAFSSQRDRVYNFVKKELEKGHQGYVICPLIEDSDTLEVKSAVALYEELKEHYFKEFNVGLLHGKLSVSEKDEIMKAFKKGKLDLLVSTTVIEVGIDVPNATVMVIEDAQRFGLSQLHQLRGRIGRGAFESYCILILGSKSREALERIKILVEETDGFVISERDLKLRGPGEFYGTRQHGIVELKIANIVYDSEIMERAKKEIERYLSSHSAKDKEFLLLKKELENRFLKINLSEVG